MRLATASVAGEDAACSWARRAVSIVLDGEAVVGEALAVVSHLSRCDECRRFAGDIAAFTAALRHRAAEPRGVDETTGRQGGEGR